MVTLVQVEFRGVTFLWCSHLQTYGITRNIGGKNIWQLVEFKGIGGFLFWRIASPGYNYIHSHSYCVT